MFTTKLLWLSAFALIGTMILLFNSCAKDHENTVQGSVPVLSTKTVTGITGTTATAGGIIVSDGGANATSKGVCWSRIPNPTINDSTNSDGMGIYNFYNELVRLEPNTTYYVRAYGTNYWGTGYGDQVIFETKDRTILYGDGVMDLDGNEYITVIIGNQEWMAENLRTTKYKDGTAIPTGHSNAQWANLTQGAYSIFPHSEIDGLNSDDAVLEAYGALYNFPHFGNLCPTGWHIPYDDEWFELLEYLDELGHPRFGKTNAAGNALKSCRQVGSYLGGYCSIDLHPRWNTDSIHYGTDAFGFSALPGGYRHHDGSFKNAGTSGHWWFKKNGNYTYWSAGIYNNSGYVGGPEQNHLQGRSIRCVKNN